MRTLMVVLTGMVAGCNAASVVDQGVICRQASDHLSACMDTSMPVDPLCDPVVAAEVLDQSCAEINGAQKADWFGDWLCSLGFLYRCPAPVCEPEPDQQAAIDTRESCSDYIDVGGCASCDYYLCREDARAEPCGESGYYLGFVRKYCLAFTELTVPRLSPAGAQWIADVRPCLQKAMESIGDDTSCDEVKRHGYDAHPGCYVSTGFCELPFTDMLAILNTVSPLDLGLQPITTALQCIKRWFTPETREITEEGYEQLEVEAAQSAF